MFNAAQFGTTDHPTVVAQWTSVPHRERPLTRRLAALAVAAAIAASLSVALPLDSQAAPQPNGNGVVVTDAAGQLPTPGETFATFVVTKGLKG